MDNHFYIIKSQREHLERHFEGSISAGSIFYDSFFATPEMLLDYVNRVTPFKIVFQSAERAAYCFATEDRSPVGTCGLGLRKDFGSNLIEFQQRDGISIEFAIVNKLPETNQFCVIADLTPLGLSIITAFPGEYARPFARAGQPKTEYEQNKKYWEEHILLKMSVS